MVIYGTDNSIPGDVIEVVSGASIEARAAFDSSVAIVGAMDTVNGSASTGQSTEVNDLSDAEVQFGADSELAAQIGLAIQNGVDTMYGVPPSETQTTENFSSTSNGTLSNDGVFDPNVTTYDITETNQGSDVNIVYEDPAGTSPQTDTINLNPTTGDWEADASATYDIQYTYGDYGSAITAAVNESPRVVALCNEEDTFVSNLVTEVNDAATSFDFMHGVAGAGVDIDTASYSDSQEEKRLSLVAPARGYTDTSQSTQARTMGAVGAYLADRPLGDTATYETIRGFSGGMYTEFDNSEASTLIDNQILVLQERDTLLLLKDMTTSTDVQFERVYANQIADEATEQAHRIGQNYVGELNIDSNRVLFEEDLKTTYAGFEDERPPLLDNFTVSVQEDPNNADEVDVSIGLNIVDVIDRVDTGITIGDVITNSGGN